MKLFDKLGKALNTYMENRETYIEEYNNAYYEEFDKQDTRLNQLREKHDELFRKYEWMSDSQLSKMLNDSSIREEDKTVIRVILGSRKNEK